MSIHTAETLAAWAAGLLFATHPVHTEAVVTGYGRAELLGGFFGVWLLARYLVTPEQHASRACFHLANTMLFLAALMSKEHAVFLWPVLMLIDLWRRYLSSKPRPAWREWVNRDVGIAHAGFALSVALFSCLRYGVFTWRIWAWGADLPIWYSPMAHSNSIQRVLTPLELLGLTSKLCVWPRMLCPIWSLPSLPLASHVNALVLLGAVVLTALVAGGVLLWRRSILGPLLLGTCILLALPLQFVAVINWLFAERWLYLPSVLAAVLAGAALALEDGRIGADGHRRHAPASIELELFPSLSRQSDHDALRRASSSRQLSRSARIVGVPAGGGRCRWRH